MASPFRHPPTNIRIKVVISLSTIHSSPKDFLTHHKSKKKNYIFYFTVFYILFYQFILLIFFCYFYIFYLLMYLFIYFDSPRQCGLLSFLPYSQILTFLFPHPWLPWTPQVLYIIVTTRLLQTWVTHSPGKMRYCTCPC